MTRMKSKPRKVDPITPVETAYKRLDMVYTDAIRIPENRMRALNETTVEALMESIMKIGLQNPITVQWRGEGNGYALIAGRHRLEAVDRLGYGEIDAVVYGPDETVEAEIIEIDENLCRAELGPAERAAHIARAKELYQSAHPETRQGHAAAAVTNAKSETANFAVSTPAFDKKMADVTGVSERAVRLDAQRGEALGARDAARIAGTCLDRGVEIDALIKLDPDTRERLISQAVRGLIVSARQPEMPPITPPVEPEAKPVRPKLSEEEREKVKVAKLESDFWKLLAKMSPELRERLVNTAKNSNTQLSCLAA